MKTATAFLAGAATGALVPLALTAWVIHEYHSSARRWRTYTGVTR